MGGRSQEGRDEWWGAGDPRRRRNPFGVSWGANDVILYGQPDGIWQVLGTGGTPVLLIPVGEGERFFGPQMLARWRVGAVDGAGGHRNLGRGADRRSVAGH